MKKLLVVAFISLFFIGCDSQNALKFNEKVVVIQNNLITKINLTPADVDENTDPTKLKQVRDFAKEKMTEVKSLSVPSGGEDFKNAMINNLQSVHDLYDYAIKLTDASLKDAERVKMETELTKMFAKAQVVENKVMQEQRKFAKKFNFELKY